MEASKERAAEGVAGQGDGLGDSLGTAEGQGVGTPPKVGGIR